MKKTNFTKILTWACCMLGLMLGGNVMAQAPAGETEITISFAAGAFANEIGWELVHVPSNTEVECVATGTFTGATVVTNCVDDEPYEFRAFDSFGDTWNGWTFTIEVTENGSANGCANPQTGLLFYDGVEAPDPGPATPNTCGNGPNATPNIFAFSTTCPACEITCPADYTVPTDPGVCDAFVVVADPILTADCVGAPAGFVTLQTPAVPYLYNFTGLINTPVPLTGAVGGAVADVEICIDFSGDHSAGGPGQVEAVTLQGPDGSNVVGTVATGFPDCQDASNCATITAATWNGWVANFGPDFDFNWPTNVQVDAFCTVATVQATITLPTSLVAFTHTINGGTPVAGTASGTFPKGDTEVCYQSVDAFGTESECCVTVTVADQELPHIIVDGDDCVDGVQDIVINLDPGLCETVIDYNVEVTDNCPSDPVLAQLAHSNQNPGTTGQAGVMFMLNNLSGADVIVEELELQTDVGTWEFFAYIGTDNTWVGHLGDGVQGMTSGNWTVLGNVTINQTVNATFNVFDIDPVTVPAGGSVAMYVASTISIAGGPLEYDINTSGPSVSNGVLQHCAGAGRTAIPDHFAGGTFGDTAPANLCGSTNYRFGHINFNYAVGSACLEPIITGPVPGDIVHKDDSPQLVTITTEDCAGNVATCTFNIIVNEYPNPVTSLTCNDNIQVSLDETCSATIGADMTLEGGPYGCYDDYIVTIISITGQDLGTNVIDDSFIGPVWTVKTTDPDTGNSCWGTFYVEDKLDPTIDCEDAELIACDAILIPVTTPPAPIVGDFDSNDTGAFISSTNNSPATATATSTGFPANAPVVDVNVSVAITHTWVADLDIDLVGPNGASINLMTGQCGALDNVDVTFDDDGFGVSCTTPIAVTGTVAPEDPLAGFNGGGGNGTWTLLVDDLVGGDDGTIDAFSVNITAQEQFVLAPQADDNCGPVTMTFVDNFDNGDCSGDAGTISRTWTATDPSGNSATCTQTISLLRPTLANVVYPEDRDGVEGAAFDCDSNPDYSATPAGAGVPMIAGQPVVNGDICDISCDWTDQEVEVCPGTTKILRTWVCIDWCEGESETVTQLIKVLDDEGPQLTSPGDLTIDVYEASSPAGGTPHSVCEGHVVIPPASSTGDNCSSIAGWITELINPNTGELLQSSNSNGGLFWDVPLLQNGQDATYTVIYRVTDQCDNESNVTITITVVDKVPPVAICDEITEISVTNNGGIGDGCSTLFAEDLDDGSYDNCKPVYYLAAKMDGPDHPQNGGTNAKADFSFSQDIFNRCYYTTRDFCCEDLGSNTVILLVLDENPNTLLGSWGNLNQPSLGCDGSTGLFLTPTVANSANFNTCMVTVEATDKLPPINLTCPGPASISCDQYWTDLEAGLSLLDGDEEAQSEFLNTWFGEPTWFDNCSVNVTRTVSINIDQCGNGSIVRTWTAFDDAGNGPASCTQVITVFHVSDFSVQFPADVVENCEDQAIDFGEPTIFNETCELIAVAFEETQFDVVQDACYKIVRDYTVINWCLYDQYGSNSEPDIQVGPRTFRSDDGYIEYQQVIKVNDTGAPTFPDGCAIPDVSILDNSCGATVVIPMPATADCSPDVSVTVTSDLGAGFGPFFNVAPGTYEVIYTAMDNCGNSNACASSVTVNDDKNPTPYCVNGLVIELMNTEPPMVEIWASDFNVGSFDNCPGDVLISLSSDVNYINETYTCNELGQQPIELWVTDAAGNQDFCLTHVQIQDNMNLCGGDPLVAGAITTEENDGAQNVDVTINSPAGTNLNQMTGNDGTYSFPMVPAGNDYTITPVNDTDHLNGVSTFDLVLISKHILGVSLLDSPYKLIAADANNSGTVTTFDMVEVRKLILFINTEFPNNTSWRFIDKSFTFANPTNPFASNFPEVININNLSQDEIDNNFVAVKIGDVNGSATANLLGGADDRNMNGQLVFNIDDVAVTAGETYTVNFTAQDFNAFGYQFTLNFDRNALNFDGVNAGLATETNFGYAMLEEGVITTSWNSDLAKQLNDNEVVFSLVFTANTNANLSELLSVSSQYTTAEAYSHNGDLMNVALNFNSTVVEAGFDLYQNTPNPFENTTAIGFNLPEAATATLTISDVSGKVLRVIEGDYAKGYNQVTVERSELSGAGVLYYQLDTPTDSATKKMILVD